MANILASKLFLTSSRQKEILSAIKDPINSELVSQMKDYLDEEFISPEYLGDNSVEDIPADTSSEGGSSGESSGGGAARRSSGGGSFGGGGFSAGLGENYMDDDIDDNSEGESTDSAEGAEGEETSDTPEDNVVDDNSGSEINTATSIEIPLDAIKGALNSREDCSGVIRIAEKDNELWIYYNDDINLNNVMTSVIDVLNSSSYSYLEFNRLARSNNAIVFDILRQSVDSYERDE